jgi:hypothetical protein
MNRAKKPLKELSNKKIIKNIIIPANNIDNNILAVESWKNTKSFKSITDKETQLSYYQKNNSPSEILQLVGLESKPFGTHMEKLISEIFDLEPRLSVENDASYKNKKIEIKSARYWAGKDDCKWQHLEPDHDYDYVLFVLLDFNALCVWPVTKKYLMGELRDKKIITNQGKQGWWTSKKNIIQYLKPVYCKEDLTNFLDTH